MNNNDKNGASDSDVTWRYDNVELCEFVMIDDFMLTLRTVNLPNHSLECLAVLTSCANWEQERQSFNGKCLTVIKVEMIEWAKKKITHVNNCVTMNS